MLCHRPARRAELEALLGSLPWLFDLHVIPASSFIRRRDAELDRAHRESGELEDLGEEQLDDDHHGSDADGGHLSSRSCAVCRKAAGPADDTDEVVLARDERLCLDVLLAHLLRRITAEGAVLGDHDRSVLSRLVVAATEDVLDAMQLCARLRLELATGEVLGPPDIMGLSDTRLSTCVLASDEIAVSEIVRDIVTGLYELIDDELVGIYLDALRRLGPAPSPSGRGRRGEVGTDRVDGIASEGQSGSSTRCTTIEAEVFASQGTVVGPASRVRGVRPVLRSGS